MQDSNSVTAILWDFGGVITSSPFAAFRQFEAQRGLPQDFIRSVNTLNPDTNAWAQLERSDINAEQFSELFRSEAITQGHDIAGSEILTLLEGSLRPQMVSALKSLRGRYTIACLTNNVRSGAGPGMNRSPQRAAAVAEVMALFEAVFESSKVGVRKPERKFYQIACENLGVEPRNAVYLDDLGINLKPARALGMQTIKVTDPTQALADLEQILGHSVTDLR